MRLITMLRWYWWRVTAGRLVADWRFAHQHKLPWFCPETGRRLTYTFRLFTPEFDPASGAAIGTQGVLVEAYPWTGGTIYNWLPRRTAPGEMFYEKRDRAFASAEWEGTLDSTLSVLLKGWG